MALEVAYSNDEALVGPEVCEVLQNGVSHSGSAVLLVPDFSTQLVASRQLAGEQGLSLGVRVTTPAAWVKERWEVWGDGSHIVEPGVRSLVMQRVLAGSSQLSNDAGTLRLLERLAREGLAWLGFDEGYRIPEDRIAKARLTPAEHSALQLVGSYAQHLHDAGFIEHCEAVAQLPQRLSCEGVEVGPVVVAGFSELKRDVRELVRGFAAHTKVRVVVRLTNERADTLMQRSLKQLGMPEQEPPQSRFPAHLPHAQNRDSELNDLLRELFGGSRGGSASPFVRSESATGGAFSKNAATTKKAGSLVAKGAVGIELPSGPDAEAEALARAIVRLSGELASAESPHRIVVGVPNVARAWRELAPKLAHRGFSVRAELVLPVTQTEAGRAFFEFAEGVAQLQELDQTWPPSESTPEGTLVRLANMTWWSPRGLIDFLMSGLSGMPVARAMDLDRSWRQNRLLVPGDVLAELQSKKTVPPRVEAATRELLRGRLGSAASKLLAPLVMASSPDGSQACEQVPDQLTLAIQKGVLTKVLDVANDLRRLGVSVAPDAPHRVSLVELVGLARRTLDEATMVVRPEVRGGGQVGCLVELVSPSRVARLQPMSADAVVLCGQTSVESPVGNGDNEADAMLDALGIEEQTDPMEMARQQFVAQLSVARRKVVLERTLVDAGSQECYPSVMLIELLSCYGVEGDSLKLKKFGRALGEKGLLYGELAETDAFANSQLGGIAPGVEAREYPSRSGVVQPALLPYVVVPPNGRKAYASGRPVLSASQIESYLECPLKWFSLRRLGLDTSDAGFGGAQMGTFVHKVLEVTHRDLLVEAAERSHLEGGIESVQRAPGVRVPGCRPDARDAQSLEQAKQKLEVVFEQERERQYLRQKRSRSQQPLVPHTSEDEGALRSLKRDLLSTLEYEADKFVGYEPRFFEWKFGRRDDVEEYAGVPIEGSIDRVDIDSEGRAVVIDYKHKSPYGFAQDYGAFGSEGLTMPTEGESFRLPRHVQALMYAQVLRRRCPDLTVTASVYLCTRGSHVLSGAVNEESAERVFGSAMPSARALPRMVVPQGAMEDLLDATEAAIALKVQELLAGNVEANPVDAHACDYCPVLNCERRMA